MVFVIDVKSINFDVTEGAQTGVDARSGTEEVPERSCELGSLVVATGEGGRCESAAEAEENFFAHALAGFDISRESRARLETSGAHGVHLGGLAAAGGTEIDAGVACWTEEVGEES